MLKHYSEYGRPLDRRDLTDVVQLMVESTPKCRREKLKFKNNRPGMNFCRGFERRHSDQIIFRSAERQQAVRYECRNGVTLVHHFSKLEYLIKSNSIDDKRIFNVDETELLAWSEKDSEKKEGYCLRGIQLLQCCASFQNIQRITMLGAVYGDGQCARPMFVMNGPELRNRSFVRSHNSGGSEIECITEWFPLNALVTMRKNVVSVDFHNFFEWTLRVVEDTAELRAHNRRMLLIYDGYISHFSIPVILKLRNASIQA